MKLSMIVAMSENRVIGRANALPWHLPGDLKRFKKITTGHAIVMGRKTYESIGRLLPNRKNIILTRQNEYKVEGAIIVKEPEAIFDLLSDQDEVFIIGGEEVYRIYLDKVDRLYVTLIHQEVEGDAWFPEYDPADFKETEREKIDATPSHSFVILDRI